MRRQFAEGSRLLWRALLLIMLLLHSSTCIRMLLPATTAVGVFYDVENKTRLHRRFAFLNSHTEQRSNMSKLRSTGTQRTALRPMNVQSQR